MKWTTPRRAAIIIGAGLAIGAGIGWRLAEGQQGIDDMRGAYGSAVKDRVASCLAAGGRPDIMVNDVLCFKDGLRIYPYPPRSEQATFGTE